MGTPRAPRDPNCDLTLAQSSDFYPGGKLAADYEHIGFVSILARENALPTDPEVKKELRPKACGLGGEVVAIGSSRKQHAMAGNVLGQIMSFMIWARKVNTDPVKY